MAKIAFKKGLLANLPAAKTEGTFYVTTDERAIYLDVSADSRIRLGDFQEFATAAALQANVNPSTSALYYVSDINCLAKWDGTKYVQINRDTGYDTISVSGDGDIVTNIVEDNVNPRKLNITKGKKIGTIPTSIEVKDGESTKTQAVTDLVDYIDKKTQDVLNRAQGGSSETAASVSAALDAYKTSNNAAVAAAQAAADAAQSDVDALETKVGEVPSDKTVVQMIADAQAAATQDISGIATNKAAIDKLNGSATQDGSVKKTVADEIAKIVNENNNGSIDTLNEIASWIVNDTSGAAKMQADITALQTSVGSTSVGTQIDNKINALDATQSQTASAANGQLALSITQTNGKITAISGSVKSGTYEPAGTVAEEIGKLDATQSQAAAAGNGQLALSITETNGKITAISGSITANTYDAYGSASSAESNAKSYTDTSLTWGNF